MVLKTAGSGLAAVTFIVASACGILYSLVYGEFATADVGVFVAYAAVFGLLSGIVFTRMRSRFLERPGMRGRLLALGVAIGTSLLGLAALTLVAGPYVDAVGIPLALCWLAGGLAAGYVAADGAVRDFQADAAYLVVSVLLVGATWQQTRATPPTIEVYFRERSTDSARDDFFRLVIGTGDSGSTEHGFRSGIAAATVVRATPAPVVDVELRRGTAESTERVLIARILAYPPVESVKVLRNRRQ